MTAFPDDALEAMATVQRAHKNLVEPTRIHENALDVLAHQIAGILMDKEKTAMQELWSRLAVLRRREDADRLRMILKRRLKGEELKGEELKKLSIARRTADLVLSYGKKAVVALQVKGVGPETAFRILGKMHFDDKEFYLDLFKS